MLAGAALAAHALAGKTYSGTGQEYENNGPHFETFKGFRQRMRLTVTADGARVQSFKGYYSYYCGAGTASVTGKGLNIRSSGRFGGQATAPAYYRSSRTGTNYFVLRGRFINGGEKAAVTYQAAFVGVRQTDPHPYSLGLQPGSASCQNKVTGTINVK